VRQGVTIGLMGDSGAGKTTQAGELAKHIRKTKGLNTLLHTADRGGYESLRPLENLGVIKTNVYDPEKHDAFLWVNGVVNGEGITDDIGLVVVDSGTTIGEALLHATAYADFQIGQQKTQKFVVRKGDAGPSLMVASNNEAHYGVLQGFILKAIWDSMKLTNKGIDVMWTFSVQRGEEQDSTRVLGPKVIGKALTPTFPRNFTYFWRIESIPQMDSRPIHRLYLTEYPDSAGMGHSFGNSRIPIGAYESLPPYLEPASIPEVFRRLEEAQVDETARLANELGITL
jgi:hypothetical protein